MKRAGKFYKRIKTVFALILAALAVLCVAVRLPQMFITGDNAALAAAAFTLTDGKYEARAGTYEQISAEPREKKEISVPAANMLDDETPPRDKSGYYDSYAGHDGEAVYSVAEKTITNDGTYVGNFFIKNRTGLDLDFEGILKTPLTFDVKKNARSPQVLIYHTHTSEAYLDETVDYYYESFYSRTQNEAFNVVAVGNKITRVLQSNGINTLHDKTVHDSTYDGSYDRSAQTVNADMKRYGDIKVVLDIHRDALGTDEQKVKTVFDHDGKKAAQIMILSGCDPSNERGFQNWQNNLSFALKLQHKAEELYPGMTRPISFDYFAYNEYICDGSLLIEIGTDANSVDEVETTGELLGEVLSKVLLDG
ncbi:MAG TPA: hypothetical protein DEO32_06530 [Ruminococcaceae bacterium]|nr:hypothetical protein [Oscillospiraceae bacterium]